MAGNGVADSYLGRDTHCGLHRRPPASLYCGDELMCSGGVSAAPYIHQ